jgi:hypothetical protein
MTPALARLVVAWAVVAAALRLTVAAPEACGAGPAPARLRAAAEAGAGWIAANQRADGSYLYEWRRGAGASPTYNVVRHAGVTLALYRAGLVDEGDAGLDWLLHRVVRRHGWAAVVEGSTVPLGATALTVAAVAERRLVTGDRHRDGLLRELARFLADLQRPDGGWPLGWDLDADAPDTSGTSRYYPGEAAWALARVAAAFPGEGWDAHAAGGVAYVALRRDDVEEVEFPPLNDHWGAYALAELAAARPLPPAWLAYARLLHGRFDLLVRSQAKRRDSGAASVLHGPERRAAALGTWVEGEAALWRLAREEPALADLAGDVLATAACGAGLLVDRQSTGGPVEEDGAWVTAGLTRNDDQQHAVAALLATADAIEATEATDRAGASR